MLTFYSIILVLSSCLVAFMLGAALLRVQHWLGTPAHPHALAMLITSILFLVVVGAPAALPLGMILIFAVNHQKIFTRAQHMPGNGLLCLLPLLGAPLFGAPLFIALDSALILGAWVGVLSISVRQERTGMAPTCLLLACGWLMFKTAPHSAALAATSLLICLGTLAHAAFFSSRPRHA